MKYLNSNLNRKILYMASGAGMGFCTAGLLENEGNLEKILDVVGIIVGGVIVGKLINYENKRYSEKINKIGVK